jgi:hypothetical protein
MLGTTRLWVGATIMVALAFLSTVARSQDVGKAGVMSDNAALYEIPPVAQAVLSGESEKSE